MFLLLLCQTIYRDTYELRKGAARDVRRTMTEAMYYVLLALHRPAHGYQLMQQIARASRGRVQMGPGTLYGVLTRMEKEGLIVLSENDGRRKTYLLTNAGMEALRAEYSRLRAMVRDGAWIGEGGTNEKTQL